MNVHPKWFKSGAEVKALVAKELYATTGKPTKAQLEAEPFNYAALPRLVQCSTVLEPTKVYPTDAAILPYTEHVLKLDKPELDILKADQLSQAWLRLCVSKGRVFLVFPLDLGKV